MVYQKVISIEINPDGISIFVPSGTTKPRGVLHTTALQNAGEGIPRITLELSRSVFPCSISIHR